jgi:hypothetical protein
MGSYVSRPPDRTGDAEATVNVTDTFAASLAVTRKPGFRAITWVRCRRLRITARCACSHRRGAAPPRRAG